MMGWKLFLSNAFGKKKLVSCDDEISFSLPQICGRHVATQCSA